MNTKKLLLVAGAIAGIAILALAAFISFMIIVGSDTLSSQATDSQVLMPGGTAIGKALVVYNPGLTGAPKTAAAEIAADLKGKGYEVCLAGVSSPAAKNASGYDVIVAGGPVYGGVVSSSIQSYLTALAPQEDVKVGAFAIGSSSLDQPFPVGITLTTTALISRDGDMGSQCSAFLETLLA